MLGGVEMSLVVCHAHRDKDSDFASTMMCISTCTPNAWRRFIPTSRERERRPVSASFDILA